MEETAGTRTAGRFADHLDPIDRAILAELRRDGRISVRALADKAHISRANAYTRIARMTDEGLITGFTVQLDPARAGLGTTAYVTVTIDQTAWRTVSARLREIPFVEHFALMGGDYDVLVLVRAPDNAALRHVVLESIQGIPGVRGSRTWLVFEEARGQGAPWDPPGGPEGPGAER
ncbi:Lrp/AsnC family transcriptional regulator [Streptomyces sp. NPDC059651]|uniref:Lrp/AsnC family transcriptional regulator n=1 Tax=Streptomyces sp. NPDC059651 TaxID=3346897 RepID=UPI0036A98584